MANIKTTVNHYLPRHTRTILSRRGFTVSATSITGQTDGLLAKLIVGGKRTVTRLKRAGFRA